jgi:hypothetical protein
MHGARYLLCAFGLLAVAVPAHADYKRSYATGLEAAGAERWDEVEARMKEALAEEATPKANVKLYGMRFETYVPQYYLGLAAYKRGDCATAMKYWETPGVEPVVQGDSKLSGPAQSGLRDCRGKVAQTAPPPTPPTTSSTQPTVASTEPPTKVEPKTPANPPPSTNVASNNPPPSTTTPPKPPPAPPTAPPATPPTAEAPSAPADLVSALDNYLGGRYAQAASVDPGKLPDPRSRYHALVVRAAARFVQAQLQPGDSGKALLSQAETDVRGAKQLQPNAAPDATLFPPKFRQFYSATR